MDQQIKLYLLACEHYEEWMSNLSAAYQSQHKYRKLLNMIKSPLDIDYKKYSSTCRRKARTLLGTKSGYEVDHIVPLKFLWAIGVPIEEANKLENLQHIRKSKNKRKSFKVNLQIAKKLFSNYI